MPWHLLQLRIATSRRSQHRQHITFAVNGCAFQPQTFPPVLTVNVANLEPVEQHGLGLFTPRPCGLVALATHEHWTHCSANGQHRLLVNCCVYNASVPVELASCTVECSPLRDVEFLGDTQRVILPERLTVDAALNQALASVAVHRGLDFWSFTP